MSNNLGRTPVSASQNQKEVTINENDDILDAALTEASSFDFTSGNVTLTDEEFQQNVLIICLNVTAARQLNTPQLKGFIVVDNSTGSETVTVTRGTSTVAVAAGETRLCVQDGTANGLLSAGGGGGGGGGNTFYDFGMPEFPGQPASDEVMGSVLLVRTVDIPADFLGSFAQVTVNPTASFTISIQDDGAEIGTVVIDTGGSATFSTAGGTAQQIAAGSKITFVAPTTTDATIDGLIIGIAGDLA